MKKLIADYFDKERWLFVVYIKGEIKSILPECQCRDDFSDWTNCYLYRAIYLHRKGLYRCEYKAY